MTQNTIRVASFIADKQQVTLYTEEGKTLVIKQGDHRLNDLIDNVLPIISRGEIAIISLEEFSVYSAFEKKTTGVIRMFKVAKSKLSKFFGASEEPEHPEAQPISVETVKAIEKALKPVEESPVVQQSVDITEEKPAQTFEQKVQEHLEPISQNDVINEETETVVAVIGENIIPGIEQIKPLIDHAIKNNSVIAVENFLKRCAAIINKRRHSVEDILKFLEKGDLPLAEDGSIIAYKVLRTHPNLPDTFVDCHSRKIPQKIGSYVCVDESLVDLNRANECSNGLHIARRGYLGSFNGDICVLCKIDPEDVITVPHGDPNKVRVKGYHILFKLSPEAWSELRSNRPMTKDKDSLSLVHKAIIGDHVARLEQVKVHAQMGGDVRITKLKDTRPEASVSQTERTNLKGAAALDDPDNISGSVNPKEINKRVNEEYSKIQNPVPEEVEEELNEQLVEEMEKEILDAPLEPLEETREQMDPVPLHEELKPEPVKANTPAQAEKLARKEREREKRLAKERAKAEADRIAEQAKKDEAARPKRSKAPVKDNRPHKMENTIPDTKPKTKAEQARNLYNIQDYASLKALKKQSKKSWDALGISLSEVENMDK